MKETDLAYYAGIFDGEGSVSLPPSQRTTARQQTTYALSARVSSTDEWLCQQLRFAFGGKVSNREQSNPNSKRIYCWEVRHIKASNFLKAILPYLHLKRDRAELGIKVQAHKTRGGPSRTKEYQDFESDYKNLLLLMNKRGK